MSFEEADATAESTPEIAQVVPAASGDDRPAGRLMRLKLREIIPDPGNVRSSIDQEGVDRLAASMDEIGQQEPLRVFYSEPVGRFVVSSGHRRLRAAELLGWDSIDAIVVPSPADHDQRIEQLATNLCREGLSVTDIHARVAAIQANTDINDSEVARKLGVSKTTISHIKLIDILSPPVKQLIKEGKIGITSIPGLAKLDPPEQREFAEALAQGQITTREFQSKVYVLKGKRAYKAKSQRVTIRLDGTTVTATSIDGLRKTVAALHRRLKTAETLEEIAQAFARKKKEDKPDDRAPEEALE